MPKADAQPTKLFPMIVTADLDTVKNFYKNTIGCEVVFDMDHYFHVRWTEAGAPEGAGPELAFMLPAPGGRPLGHEPGEFPGKGLVVSIPVGDADAYAKTLATRGVKAATEPSDKPWGWRSFVVVDPTGTALDFFHASAQPAAVDAAS